MFNTQNSDFNSKSSTEISTLILIQLVQLIVSSNVNYCTVKPVLCGHSKEHIRHVLNIHRLSMKAFKEMMIKVTQDNLLLNRGVVTKASLTVNVFHFPIHIADRHS